MTKNSNSSATLEQLLFKSFKNCGVRVKKMINNKNKK